MNGIKILLITGVLLIAVYFFVRLRNSLLDIMLLLLLIMAAVVFILFPDITNTIAHKLGVGRGADLVFYISIIIFWFVLLKLYARIRRLEQLITRVVRKDALDEAGNDTAQNKKS
jgi:small membrane protein